MENGKLKIRYIHIILLLLAATVAQAAHYPDSVAQISSRQSLTKGLYVEVGAGIGLSQLRYCHWGEQVSGTIVNNSIAFPALTADARVTWFFNDIIGLSAGIGVSSFRSKAILSEPFILNGNDADGDAYVITLTPQDWYERQSLTMLELPVLLRLKYNPGLVGFTGAIGARFGFPVQSNYKTNTSAAFTQTLEYPLYNLTVPGPVPHMLSGTDFPYLNAPIPATMLHTMNYAAYIEAGASFRVHKRLELLLAAYCVYYINDLFSPHDRSALGFNNNYDPESLYPSPFAEDYNGILLTKEAPALHPWSAGLKLTLGIYTGRTPSEMQYDRGEMIPELEELRRQKELEERIQPTDTNQIQGRLVSTSELQIARETNETMGQIAELDSATFYAQPQSVLAPLEEKKEEPLPQLTTEVVKKGSRLAQISRRHYGDPAFWVYIYEANRWQIRYPNVLLPGIVLVIPDIAPKLQGKTRKEAIQEAKALGERYLQETLIENSKQ